MVQSIQGLAFAPITVALKGGIFTEAGLDVEWALVSGAAVALGALTGGGADVAAGASTEIMTGVVRDLPLVAVGGIATSMTMDTVVSKRYAEARGISAASPLEQRIAALRGATMGITSPGGSPDRYGKWLMTRGGFDPDDLSNQRAGGSVEIMAALRQGLLDGFLLSAPAGPQLEKEGEAVVLISYQDVPEFKDFVHETLHTTRAFAERSPDTVTKLAVALARANTFIHDERARAKEILIAEYPTIDPAVVATSIDRMVDSFPRDGRMTRSAWDNTVKIHVESGAIDQALDTREGEWWTNRYLP